MKHIAVLLLASSLIFAADAESRTLFGFFPSPTRLKIESVFETYKRIARHGSVVLHQPNVPWREFLRSPDADCKAMTDLSNQMVITRMNGLNAIFVIDPLNGLNRSEFSRLPLGWKAKFSNPDIRAAFTNFTLRVLREFHPAYIGLASEINTYLDAFPDDISNYLSLYRETYALIKSISPSTKVFVTFQWEDLDNLMPDRTEGGTPGEAKWDTIGMFDAHLDLWVFSTYPFLAYSNASQIPRGYFTKILSHTKKPIAVAEGGFSSRPIAPWGGGEQDQIDYIKAIDRELRPQLAFWIYLIVNDLDMRDYGPGAGKESPVLNFFSRMGFYDTAGKAKPALAVWDTIRKKK